MKRHRLVCSAHSRADNLPKAAASSAGNSCPLLLPLLLRSTPGS